MDVRYSICYRRFIDKDVWGRPGYYPSRLECQTHVKYSPLSLPLDLDFQDGQVCTDTGTSLRCIALVHQVFSTKQWHSYAHINPLEERQTSDGRWES